jgi:hypothetical protein
MPRKTRRRRDADIVAGTDDVVFLERVEHVQ